MNQIEIHVGNLELEFVPYMQSRGIIPFAYSPLGGMGSEYMLSNNILVAVAERIGATPAQTIIAYLLKRGIGVVTTSKRIQHMSDSINATRYIDTLTDTDITAINSTDGFGPLIEGAVLALNDNMNLY